MLPAHIFCTNCGVKNQTHAAFCFSCGKQFARPNTAANPFQAPANAASSSQQVSALQAQVSAPIKRVTEPPLAQGAIAPVTGTGNPNTSGIDSATGFLSANTVLKQRYRILHPIGRGGMGAVYMGQDMQLGQRLVAIKEMSQSSLYPQEVQTGVDNFKREAHLLAGLQHPNLPSIYDHFEQNQRWYLVMSFIQGDTLHDYMKYVPNGKLPLEEVLKIGIELCAVLHYLHTYQPPIIFRDLKPSNIMRDKNGHTYLIDFGIARHFKPGQEKDTASFASAGYASPEQYGQAQTTPRSDIYSLGATLYQLLSGYAPSQSPFHLPPLQALVPTLPPRLISLITGMLDLEENRRPPDMQTVKQELQAIAGSPTTPNAGGMLAGQPSSGAALSIAGYPISAATLQQILPPQTRERALVILGSLSALFGFILLLGSTGTIWYEYFSYQSSYFYTSYILISSIMLLLGLLMFYIPCAKFLSIAAAATITNKRQTLARAGAISGYILLVWGIWGWVHASPYNYISGNDTYLSHSWNSSYIYPTLGFALLALTGVLIILATTTKSLGLSHAKSKEETIQRVQIILGTFLLLFGTTFLLPETIAVSIICFLVGGGALITAQWRP